ncbi:MAG: DUF5682 family protein [Bacteroidota bacterium]
MKSGSRKSLPDCKVFGIRHHGPGSARRLWTALEQYQPDCVVVEFPADAETELRQATRLVLEPPVALVLYSQADLQQAYYYPFARFSPEWQAIQWAAQNEAEIIAMDLPISHQMARRQQPQLQIKTQPTTSPSLYRDPLGEAARIAGYEDREQWWDITFEQEQDDFALFAAINELIRELRTGHQDSPEILLREAYMRKVLRKALKSDAARIAVVCGAWHSPALEEVARYKASADQKLLKGLPKAKVKAAWIPWSYPRLAKESGYGAGVQSPAWYELRFDYPGEAAIHWMVAAAQLLRKEGLDASPAHAQEAVRLARTLALLRGQRIPNLADLRAAAESTLCEGAKERLALIQARLELGDKVGKVPENASVVPLQKDLTQLLKTSRLNKYWGAIGERWVKSTKANPRGGIDLREPTDLLKSQLLHQLQILDLPWGERGETSANALGAFREFWLLDWQPEFSLSILEAAMWGNTVAEAADKKLRQQAADASIGTLAQAIMLGLRSQLPAAVQQLTERLRDRSALTRDVQELLAGLPTIIRIIQYGDARKTDVTALALLIEELTPRLAAALPANATQIDEEAAQLLRNDLLATHRGLCQLDLPLLDTHWWPALRKLADLPGIAPLLQGLAVRLLLDREKLTVEDCGRRLDYALSAGNPPLEVANWLAGFLNGSGLLLVHHPALFQLVNDWVERLDMEELEGILPLLRRTFARFSPGERQQLLTLVRRKMQPVATSSTDAATDAVTDAFVPSLAEEILAGVREWG